MVFLGIIPARYASTRFPGKPLAIINGKPMIQHVYENAKTALDEVWVATDDQRIFDSVISFGGNAIFTSEDHKSGTDRCAEAAQKIAQNLDFDFVINIQGDEPFLKGAHLESLKDCINADTEIATLVKEATRNSEIFDPNKPKVVLDNEGNALYFSRSPIPYLRDSNQDEWINKQDYWMHIGVYAYRADILQKITQIGQGYLEKAESLEQLRWLENNFKIKTAVTNYESFGIDTQKDLEKALQLFK